MLTFRSLAPLAAAAVLSFAALPATAVTTCQFGTEAGPPETLRLRGGIWRHVQPADRSARPAGAVLGSEFR